MRLQENKAAIKALSEKLDNFDGEIIGISIEYEVSLKDIIAALAYSFMRKHEDLQGFSDGEIKKAAQDVLSTEDVN